MTRIFWQAFGVVASAVMGALWWLIGYMAQWPTVGAVALGVVAAGGVYRFWCWFTAKSADDSGTDDGSGERPVWSALDVQDRLSPHSAWAHGNSILPSGDDTQEMRRPDLDATHVTRPDEVYGYRPRRLKADR